VALAEAEGSKPSPMAGANPRGASWCNGTLPSTTGWNNTTGQWRFTPTRRPCSKVERSFSTAQDRLVKGLRVAGEKTLEQANAYLQQEFLQGFPAVPRKCGTLQFF